MKGFAPSAVSPGDFGTDLGVLVIGDCIGSLRQIPDDSLDLVITSPPYDRQGKYRDGERYARAWFEDFFLKVSSEVLRTLKPSGSAPE